MNYNNLQKCILFKDKSPIYLKSIFNKINFSIKEYKSNEIVLDECKSTPQIAIILSGMVKIEKLFSNGKLVNLNRLKSGGVFGLASLFSQKRLYPTTITAVSPCEILFIPEKSLLKLLSFDEEILYNYLNFSNNRILFLNERIELFSLTTAKEKIIYYLLNEIKKQHSSEKIYLSFSKECLAEHLGISRASLYRELKKLSDTNLISYKNRSILIRNMDVLKLNIC